MAYVRYCTDGAGSGEEGRRGGGGGCRSRVSSFRDEGAEGCGYECVTDSAEVSIVLLSWSLRIEGGSCLLLFSADRAFCSAHTQAPAYLTGAIAGDKIVKEYGWDREGVRSGWMKMAFAAVSGIFNRGRLSRVGVK